MYLYPSAEDAQNGYQVGGTGFLVDLLDHQSGEYCRYVVTNGHVVHGGAKTLRVNTIDGGTELIEIPDSEWVSHPDGDDIAAAAMSVSERRLAVTALRWDDFAATRERMHELNMGVGDDIFMLGRFGAHSGRYQNQPVARFGNIAMMPGEPVLDGRQLRVEAFLVEMRSLAGFSGSPVFVYMGPGTYRGDGRMMRFFEEAIGIIGIDTGHKTLNSPVLERSTHHPVFINWVVPQSTGVSIVSPVWKIRELLDDEDLVKARSTTDKK